MSDFVHNLVARGAGLPVSLPADPTPRASVAQPLSPLPGAMAETWAPGGDVRPLEEVAPPATRSAPPLEVAGPEEPRPPAARAVPPDPPAIAEPGSVEAPAPAASAIAVPPQAAALAEAPEARPTARDAAPSVVAPGAAAAPRGPATPPSPEDEPQPADSPAPTEDAAVPDPPAPAVEPASWLEPVGSTIDLVEPAEPDPAEPPAELAPPPAEPAQTAADARRPQPAHADAPRALVARPSDEVRTDPFEVGTAGRPAAPPHRDGTVPRGGVAARVREALRGAAESTARPAVTTLDQQGRAAEAPVPAESPGGQVPVGSSRHPAASAEPAPRARAARPPGRIEGKAIESSRGIPVRTTSASPPAVQARPVVPVPAGASRTMPVRDPAPAAPRIDVRIGAVEVLRLVPEPPAEGAAPSPQAPGGFDQYAAVRSYRL